MFIYCSIESKVTCDIWEMETQRDEERGARLGHHVNNVLICGNHLQQTYSWFNEMGQGDLSVLQWTDRMLGVLQAKSSRERWQAHSIFLHLHS